MHLCAGTPHFSFLCVLALLTADDVSCHGRLYRTVPQALKLFTLLQPRYNGHHTPSFVEHV